MNVLIIGHALAAVKPPSPAAHLSPGERRDLAVKVLAGTEPVRNLAQQNDVSRKFLYAQARKAEEALEEAFDPALREANSRVLFYIPVTKEWLCQVVLALILICHSSIRGVCEFFATLFDWSISVGTVHNVLHRAAREARAINAREDLSGIRAGAHDEIFQAGKPVLAGADVASTYCYLLALADERDADTWGVHLLDLAEHGLKPDYTIADGGTALRAAQAEAWPGIPCRGDVFHPLRELGRLSMSLTGRAKSARTCREKLERKAAQIRKRCKDARITLMRLPGARAAEKQAVDLAEAVETLAKWLREDVLALVGPDFTTRQELFDFVVDELKQREPLAPDRIAPVRRGLENQRDELLAFARGLDHELEEIAHGFDVPTDLVRWVYELEGIVRSEKRDPHRELNLREYLSTAFHPILDAVQDLLAATIRASSIIENLNSRLRNYFFLRRHLNQNYLDLLRFFLNHRRFLRSEHPERAGKSPVEILTGRAHPHWLEDLGFKRLRRVG